MFKRLLALIGVGALLRKLTERKRGMKRSRFDRGMGLRHDPFGHGGLAGLFGRRRRSMI